MVYGILITFSRVKFSIFLKGLTGMAVATVAVIT
jgi:hypothetical protein